MRTAYRAAAHRLRLRPVDRTSATRFSLQRSAREVDAGERPDRCGRCRSGRCRSSYGQGRNDDRTPPTRGDTTMRCMVIVKANRESEAGVMPSEQLLTEMGKLQRGAGEGRHHAGGRGPASQLEGRAGEVLRPSAHGDRRTVRRDQGTDRRLLAVAGEVDGGGDRMAQARAVRRRHRDRDCARYSRRTISAPSSRPSCASRKSGCARRWPPNHEPGIRAGFDEKAEGVLPCNCQISDLPRQRRSAFTL